jgi:hypothetical protein
LYQEGIYRGDLLIIREQKEYHLKEGDLFIDDGGKVNRFYIGRNANIQGKVIGVFRYIQL